MPPKSRLRLSPSSQPCLSTFHHFSLTAPKGYRKWERKKNKIKVWVPQICRESTERCFKTSYRNLWPLGTGAENAHDRSSAPENGGQQSQSQGFPYSEYLFSNSDQFWKTGTLGNVLRTKFSRSGTRSKIGLHPGRHSSSLCFLFLCRPGCYQSFLTLISCLSLLSSTPHSKALYEHPD